MTDGNVLDLFADEHRAEALEAVCREVGHVEYPNRTHDLTEYRDFPRDCVDVLCACGWGQMFTCTVLEDLLLPKARKLAYEKTRLAREMRGMQISAEVREAPSFRGPERLKDAAKKALEDRDPEEAVRAITELMRPATVSGP